MTCLDSFPISDLMPPLDSLPRCVWVCSIFTKLVYSGNINAHRGIVLFVPSSCKNKWKKKPQRCLPPQDSSNHRSRVADGPSRQSCISLTNWVSDQPLVWVWIWLIGSQLSRAFIAPCRQLTEKSDQCKICNPLQFVTIWCNLIEETAHQKPAHLSCFLWCIYN